MAHYNFRDLNLEPVTEPIDAGERTVALFFVETAQQLVNPSYFKGDPYKESDI